MRDVRIIAAVGIGGVIGRDGKLPWQGKLKGELAHFRDTTTGCPVIMGRKTYLSIPPKFRPLPERHNIILTRHPDPAGAYGQHPDLYWRASLAAGLDTADLLNEARRGPGPIWIAGGAEVYREAAPFATHAVLTLVHSYYAGDVYLPVLGEGWEREGEVEHHDGWSVVRLTNL